MWVPVLVMAEGTVAMARKKWAVVKGLLAKPGKHGVGDNLWVTVTEPGRGAWSLRFGWQGKHPEMGLGGTDRVSYAEAGEAADAALKLLRSGVNPLEARRAKKAAAAVTAARAVTFKQAAEAFITANDAGWKNRKHAAQWTATLTAYAYPVMGDLPVADVTTEHALKILSPLWGSKTETAVRLRGRCDQIWLYAKTRGWCSGEPPFAWRGHLQLTLPRPSKVRTVQHHAALPWKEIPAFMAALAGQQGIGAAALRFAILTAARSGEVRGATWGEIDLAGATWSIPGERMKGGRLHRCPLSDAARAILHDMAPVRDPEAGGAALIFPGAKRGRPLSDMSLTAVLRRMGRGGLTAHGFRSTFRDWCAETTNYPRELAEAALAHTLESKTEAAYQRGDLLEKRRAMTDAWAAFCGSATVPAEPARAEAEVVG